MKRRHKRALARPNYYERCYNMFPILEREVINWRSRRNCLISLRAEPTYKKYKLLGRKTKTITGTVMRKHYMLLHRARHRNLIFRRLLVGSNHMTYIIPAKSE